METRLQAAKTNTRKLASIQARSAFVLFLILLFLKEARSIASFCAGKTDGLYAHPSDCNKYLTCHVGISYLHSCGGNLVFNSAPAILSCDYPNNVDCLPGGLRGTNPGFCHDKPNGLHPHPTDCSKFYNCHGGNGAATACPARTLYNRVSRNCDWADNVNCGGGGTRSNPANFCSGKADGLYPNPLDCNKYYQCYHSGHTAEHSCFSGLLFDPVLKVCNWPESVQCSTTPAPTNAPTAGLTNSPTGAPTNSPTAAPTNSPTAAPTNSPTAGPTNSPTGAPTNSPTGAPTNSPTAAPTNSPTAAPTGPPTQAPPTGNQCPRRVCYHTNWSQYRREPGKFLPEDIDPFLCTHIMYSFANLVNNELVAFEWNDESTEWSVGMYEKVTKLKQENSQLKVLLAVGGWNMGSTPFTAMVATPQTRAHFITTSINFLRQRNFDGLDLDWEYPADRGSPAVDKDRFTALVQELRSAFNAEGLSTDRPPLLLTAAVAAGKDKIDNGYDIPAISSQLDFINLMAYDLHGSWEDFTGHNSPLYAGDHETNEARQMNVDWAASYWISGGCPPNKLVVGLPLYGRSFTLATGDTSVGAPATPGLSGPITGEAGYASYYEVCGMLQQPEAQPRVLNDQRVPYLVVGSQWVGYDDPNSLREKVQYARSEGYGGVMVWAIDLDDFTGFACNAGPYPLLNAIKEECQRP